MSEHITGKLVLAGEYRAEDQVDPEAPLARVVIVMPKAVLREVKRLPMFGDVVVVPRAEYESELALLRHRIRELEEWKVTDAVARMRQEVVGLRQEVRAQLLQGGNHDDKDQGTGAG